MKANREPMAGKAKMRNPMKSVKRLLGYIFENYKIHCFVSISMYINKFHCKCYWNNVFEKPY